MLTSPCIPSSSFDYKANVTSGKRPFLPAWLKQYDWLCYSTVLKGALCKFWGFLKGGFNESQLFIIFFNFYYTGLLITAT